MRFLRTVTASTMIADLSFRRQGWMSHRDVENGAIRVVEVSTTEELRTVS